MSDSPAHIPFWLLVQPDQNTGGQGNASSKDKKDASKKRSGSSKTGQGSSSHGSSSSSSSKSKGK